MSVRRAIVEAVPAEMNVAEFCREHGISTWFFWELRRRYASDGEAALTPRSRAPHHPASRTSAEMEDRIVTVRKELTDVGLDAGPGSIAFYLRDIPGVPSESTIWRILVARGLVVRQPAKAPRPRGGFTAQRANECWALDDTTWQLANGTRVKIFNVIDDHSRLCVSSVAMRACTGAAAFQALATAAIDYGWPARTWSDNAKAFRHPLTEALRPLGVITSHTKPYHPHSNGKIERFHLTLQKWLTRQPAPRSFAQLQAQLDEFRSIYNTRRPHRALGRRIPLDVWTQAAKTGPGERSVDTPTQVHDAIVTGGRVQMSRYRIALGAAHNGQRALVVITGTACHVFIDGRLIRHFTLDPTKRPQRLYDRPGRPTPTERKAPRHA